MKTCIAVFVLSAACFSSEIVGLSPSGKKLFTMPMDDKDSIGSIIQCMDRVEYRKVLFFRVHRKGGGFCQIEPGSIRWGKHTDLYVKYPDVFLSLKK
jgi:hypothetical protein